jgi:hypothetical protein
VEGKFGSLFSRVNSITKKNGAFDVSEQRHYNKNYILIYFIKSSTIKEYCPMRHTASVLSGCH